MSLLNLFLFAIGFVCLVAGAELLVRGASTLAIAAGLSPLVIGLTVVAYGTSAPELAVSLQSSYSNQADLAVGNIVGSNISNILLILGISATVAPLFVAKQLVRLDVPLMIGSSILLFIMSIDGTINALEGSILVIGAIAYTIFTVWESRRESRQEALLASLDSSEESPEVDDTNSPSLQSTSQPISQSISQSSVNPPPPQPQKKKRWFHFGAPITVLIVGIAILVLGANLMVSGAVTIAQYLGVSELIIGLTIVAIGTSLPEIATSVVASLRGERDIAVGNAVGSNTFNILLVIGLCSIVTPGGLAVAPSVISFDMPVMITVSVACLPIFFTGYMVLRQEGLLFLAYYVAYMLYLFLYATEHDALEEYSLVMIVFVVPLTLLTLGGLAIQAFRTNHLGHYSSTEDEL